MKAEVMAAVVQKATAEKDLLKIPGVNAVDVGFKYVNGKKTDEIAIRVHVTKKKDKVPANEKIPAEINGIKTDVIEGTYEAQLVAKKQVVNVDAQADTNTYRPLQGGVSIGPNRSVGGFIYAGTLGCFVKDNATGKALMLSNFHVMCIDNTWHVGDIMDQPSLIDTGTAADAVGTLNRAVLSAHVDGAVANINAGVSYQATIADIGNIAGTGTAALGDAVRKRGRTTGLTYGTVDGINGTANVNYGPAIGTKTLTNQIFIAPDTSHNAMFSDHGDSGSAIVNASNHVVGLLFAGGPSLTIANPIAFVQSELNVTVIPYLVKHKEIFKEVHKEIIKEGKELKHEKIEKVEIKEHKDIIFDHKAIKDHDNKLIDHNPIVNPPINQNPIGGLDQRVQDLENVVANLTSFIESSLRPDLSSGALSNE